MSDDEQRAIGRLEGKVDMMLKAQAEMQKDIKSFGLWKAKVIGAATVLGGLAGFLSKFIN